MSLSASQITKDALIKLKAGGARVRRVNNVGAYKKRAHQVESGWPDIQGYSSKGIIILCEVKTTGDTLSKEQHERLKDCRDCGGLAYVATEKRGQTIIYSYTEYILQ
jgi:VRR-NUC domain